MISRRAKKSPVRPIRNRLVVESLESRIVLTATSGLDSITPLDTPSEPVPLANYVTAPNDDYLLYAADLGSVDDSLAVTDQIGWPDWYDHLKFTVPGEADVQIGLTGLTADANFDVFDSSYRWLGSEFQAGTADESYSATLAAGEYYVRVRAGTFLSTNYVVTLEVDVIPPPPQFEFVADYGSSIDWNLNAVNAPEVWEAGYTGEGVTVAVIDTGVDWQHSDLAGNIWQNPGEIAGDGIDNDGNGFVDDIRGWDFVTDDADPSDAGSHGTHVAGTVAALRDNVGSTGVAYDATIMPIRVLGAQSGSYTDVAAGIRYAVDNGADVINLSLGGGYNYQVYAALQYAEANDVFVAAAAGNDSFARPGFPARHSGQLNNVLSVGSHTSNGSFSSFSNGANSVYDVQVDAPGSSIYSTVPDDRYGWKSGTSMAAPHVAGLAALMLSANPDLSAAQLRDLLVDGATEEITGAWASGGVNASISTFAATQTVGLSESADGESASGSTTNANATAQAWALEDSTRDEDEIQLPSFGYEAPASYAPSDVEGEDDAEDGELVDEIFSAWESLA